MATSSPPVRAARFVFAARSYRRGRWRAQARVRLTRDDVPERDTVENEKRIDGTAEGAAGGRGRCANRMTLADSGTEGGDNLGVIGPWHLGTILQGWHGGPTSNALRRYSVNRTHAPSRVTYAPSCHPRFEIRHDDSGTDNPVLRAVIVIFRFAGDRQGRSQVNSKNQVPVIRFSYSRCLATCQEARLSGGCWRRGSVVIVLHLPRRVGHGGPNGSTSKHHDHYHCKHTKGECLHQQYRAISRSAFCS